MERSKTGARSAPGRIAHHQCCHSPALLAGSPASGQAPAASFWICYSVQVSLLQHLPGLSPQGRGPRQQGEGEPASLSSRSHGSMSASVPPCRSAHPCQSTHPCWTAHPCRSVHPCRSMHPCQSMPGLSSERGQGVRGRTCIMTAHHTRSQSCSTHRFTCPISHGDTVPARAGCTWCAARAELPAGFLQQ